MQLVNMKIGSSTQYIISTSGRISSMKRYQKLLQEVLRIDIAYLPISSYSEDGLIHPENFANAIRGLGAIGGAISKDIKGKIIQHIDQLDSFAQKVQSVNTVIREGDKLIGYNTDAYGFEIAIAKGMEQSGIKINSALIYGYGGVFNIVYHVLRNLNIEVFVTGRRASEVDRINQEYKLNTHDGSPKDLFVNATPVTDNVLDDAPGFLEAIYGSKMAFDHHMPGNCMEEYCDQSGIYYLPGTDMYYPQMYKQWALFLKGQVNESDLSELIDEASK